MKAIVTGGAGFIGSHLTEKLLKEGLEVHIIDNLSRGSLDNLKHLDKNIEFHKLDFAEQTGELKTVFADADYVFHLGALTDIMESLKNPQMYHRTNVDGTFNVLEATKNTAIKKFIFISSSACYGAPDIFPTPETAEVKIQNPYSLSKYVGELYTLAMERSYGIPCNRLRLFNVYGPRSQITGTYGSVFGIFLSQKIHGAPFTVVGDGSQTRDFVYASDIAEAMWKAATSDASGEVFNIGSGEMHSINELVQHLGGEVINIPNRPGEAKKSLADISKAREILGWEPTVSFEEGIKKMLADIDYWKNAPVRTAEHFK